MMSLRIPLLGPVSALSLAGMLGLAGCLIQGEGRFVEGGNASETTNHIAGVIRDGSCAPAARVAVRLVKADFNPVIDSLPGNAAVVTDGNGRFAFSNPGPGSYQVEAVAAAEGHAGLHPAFHYSGGVLKLPDLVLDRPGLLAVTLSDSLRAAGGTLFIPGTTFSVEVGERHRTLFDPLPKMKIPLLAFASRGGGELRTIARDINISPGETAEIRKQGNDSIPIPKDRSGTLVFRLNTTATGAGVEQDQYGFPLLLRLDSSDFDFSRVPEGGAGIVFRNAAGTPLPFAIEGWDDRARKAEIWIRMDTVKGGADTQLIVMQPAPAPGAMPLTERPVFGAGDGFAGVWHMGSAAGDRPDASGNGHWARPVYYDGEPVEGRIGRADRMDTLNGFFDVGIVDVERTITLSAWVKPEPGDHWSAVVQKPSLSSLNDAPGAPWQLSYGLMQYGAGDSLGFTASDGVLYPARIVSADAGAWALITATYDGEYCVLYRDGRRIASFASPFPGSLERNGLSTTIGGYTLAYSRFRYARFDGLVDEVRIETVARSDAWIRLCHENQKAGQRLISPVGLKALP